MTGLIGAIKGKRNADVPMRTLLGHLVIALLPLLAAALLMGPIYLMVTSPTVVDTTGLQEMGTVDTTGVVDESDVGSLQEPEAEGGLQEPPAEPGPEAPVLLTSFFPLAILIVGVLGSIIAGLATPTEAAAMGSFGGLFLAIAYGRFNWTMLKESVFLTAKTSAMVCWLFVGSGIFAGAFALLGGQEIINNWVLSLDMTPVQFMLMAQVIIFLLGWPLEWTEIIIIFLPIFLPLLVQFNIDPLFFGILVALNLQTAFLSPPVAMAAFYLKGVAPPHVTLNQIFLGMLPFMAIQVLAIFLLYMFPAIGLWLPSLVYGH